MVNDCKGKIRLSMIDSIYYLQVPDDVGRALESLHITVPQETIDFLRVLVFGAQKYDADNWLTDEGNGCERKEMMGSISRHAAEGFFNKVDESGLDADLHLACRAVMRYTRRKLGLNHPKDKRGETNELNKSIS